MTRTYNEIMKEACTAGDEPLSQKLYKAIRDGNKPDIRAALEEGANPNNIIDCFTPIHSVINRTKFSNYDKMEILELLINKGADVNLSHQGNSPAVILAVAKGEVEVVKLLLDNGAKVDLYTVSNHYVNNVKESLAKDSELESARKLEKVKAAEQLVIDKYEYLNSEQYYYDATEYFAKDNNGEDAYFNQFHFLPELVMEKLVGYCVEPTGCDPEA